ncbi:MAG: prefoldin subunit alpha [Candidatus Aenigmatarchaeota archaeon]
MEEKEKNEAIARYASLQIKLEALLKQREELIERIEEIEETLEALKEVKENVNSIFSLGSGAYCFGKIESKKVLVNVGSNVLIEMDKERAIETLEKRKNTIYNIVQEIERQSISIISEQEEIAKKIKGV